MSIHVLHPALGAELAKQRQSELQAEARRFHIAAREKSANKVERFFIKRREGKITWIDTVLVQRSA